MVNTELVIQTISFVNKYFSIKQTKITRMQDNRMFFVFFRRCTKVFNLHCITLLLLAVLIAPAINCIRAQEKVHPLVQLGFNHFIGEGLIPYTKGSLISYLPSIERTGLLAKGLWAHEFHLGGGVQVCNKLDVLLNVRILQSVMSFSDIPSYEEYNTAIVSSIYPAPPFRSLTLSIAPAYRFLSGTCSPLFGVEAGTELYSNARNKFMSGYMIRLPELGPSVEGIYNSGVFFGKAKLMCDYRHKNLRFQSGLSFSYYEFSMTKAWLSDKYITVYYVDPSEQYVTGDKYTQVHYGLGFEFAIVYTFNKGNKKEGKLK